MKATITFTLPEENKAHLRCIKAHDLCSVIRDMDEWLRGKIKYGESLSKEERDMLKLIRASLHSIMDSQDIDMDELY